jgi:hypothetical protein
MNTEQLQNELQSLKGRIAELEKQVVSDSPTWENVVVGEEGWYVGGLSKVIKCPITDEDDRNTFPTREHAEAVLAESQLMWLRDHYRNGWKPEVGKPCEVVVKRRGVVQTLFLMEFQEDDNSLFAFQDKATAERFINEQFLNEQRPLLETYFKKFSL